MAKHLDLLSVSPELPATLHLRFRDGVCMRLDVAPLIQDMHPAFEELRAPATFMQATLGGHLFAGAVCWPARYPLMIRPFELRALALHQATGRGPGLVRDWMASNRLSVPAAAAALGVSRRMVVHYRNAQRPVPLKVVLAIAGWTKKQETGTPATDRTPDVLRQWLARWGHTYQRGALALGVSRRMLAYYLSGDKPIPHRVALAMAGWNESKHLTRQK